MSLADEDVNGPRLAVEIPFSYARKKVGSDYSSLSRLSPSPACLDIRVFYVRVSCGSLDETPDSLTIRYLPRLVGTGLEVNGGRVSPAEEAVLTLRRDRVDAESAEAIYVSTDNLRTSGSLPFEVYDREELLLCGIMDRLDSSSDGQGINLLDSVGTLIKNCKTNWRMECCCAITSSRCAFLEKKSDFTTAKFLQPSMEVYVAGRFSGSPVVLTQTVQLTVRRRNSRRGALDAIPEVDESERSSNSLALGDLADQIEEQRIYEEMGNKAVTGVGRYYGSESSGFVEGEDGELTWFNAGVRVGVGIGLGMCLGIGIGVGLLIRTYQATTRTFRRRFL